MTLALILLLSFEIEETFLGFTCWLRVSFLEARSKEFKNFCLFVGIARTVLVLVLLFNLFVFHLFEHA